MTRYSFGGIEIDSSGPSGCRRFFQRIYDRVRKFTQGVEVAEISSKIHIEPQREGSFYPDSSGSFEIMPPRFACGRGVVESPYRNSTTRGMPYHGELTVKIKEQGTALPDFVFRPRAGIGSRPEGNLFGYYYDCLRKA
jgi:hypothetical protein